MAETIGTVACIGNPIADKGHGEEAYERAFDLLGREGERYGFAVIDLTGGSFGGVVGERAAARGTL